jgi:hypothetical protein
MTSQNVPPLSMQILTLPSGLTATGILTTLGRGCVPDRKRQGDDMCNGRCLLTGTDVAASSSPTMPAGERFIGRARRVCLFPGRPATESECVSATSSVGLLSSRKSAYRIPALSP